MLVTVITEKSYCGAKQKIEQVSALADVIELRIDYFEHIRLYEIEKLKDFSSLPMIFTVRKKSQVGFFQGSETRRLKIIKQLAALQPAYIDIEFDVSLDFVEDLKAHYPTIQFICSYHDFEKTPNNFFDTLENLRHDVFSIYKIVTFAHSTLDAFRMLNFVQDLSADIKITGFCMGERGMASRILGPVVGNTLTYVCIDENKPVAPGQLSLSTVLDIYRFRALNQETQIYALIGNPVDKSEGHVFHNRAFSELDKNAVYVKLHLELEEVSDFFSYIKSLPFQGLSVTMPFKQAIIPYLDHVDGQAMAMESVNTLVRCKGKWHGFNTDANGALDVIEKKSAVENKTILILGAGGAARAIGYEAIQRKANIIFVNRSAEKAHTLAKKMGCLGYGIDEMEKIKYDIVINATPIGMIPENNALPLPADFLIPKTIVMDTVYNPMETALLKKARELNCAVIYGYEMFVNQAMLQLELWFNQDVR